MAFNINLDRGVQSRSDPQTGMEIYMYWDDPGVYLSAHGTEVDVALAVRAGFPTEEHLKKRRIKLAVKAAQDKVLAELAEADGSEKVVLTERDGFKVLDMGYDRYQVVDPDGDAVHPNFLDKRSAVILLDQLVPNEAPAQAPEAHPEV